MMHHLARRGPALTGPELHYSIAPFPLPPAAVDADKGQEQRTGTKDACGRNLLS